MSLATGTRLGNYEILAPIGAGGMGDVYRARDVRLERTVAIKALSEAFADDPERIARFEREARILASVHHANIAAIYGIEDAGDGSYLVLEHIEGETLAHRLSRGPLPVAETLDIGVQVASAIDAAHEQGVVHRDLKPSNVMLTTAGVAKVLDFGLAKNWTAVNESPAGLSMSPTLAMSATGAGVILGTAPYMSPEQARGKPVDRRADVWALGCLLYECLTGRQAFEGETASDVIARILEREPDLQALPAGVPASLRDLTRRCLTKNPEQRPRDVGDLRRELQSMAMELSSPTASTRSATAAPSVAVLYFENLSHDADNDYFCAGITEDILTDLSKIRGLRVASRKAVERYRGESVDIQRVARELSVRAVLEGSIRRAGDRVRITAQLVSGDGFHLWAERYDRTLQDVFAVQEEIASAIARALEVALTPAEAEKLGESRPKDVRAYDLYLKGRQNYERRTGEALRAAMALFEQAVEVDPGYALAHAGIADVFGQYLQWDLSEDRNNCVECGLNAAGRAIELNPKLPEAYKAKALVLRAVHDQAGALAALRTALEFDPRHTPSINNLAVNVFCTGDMAEAERLFRRALVIEPDMVHSALWMSLLAQLTNRQEEFERASDRVLALTTDQFYVTGIHLARMWECVRRERPEELERRVQQSRSARLRPGNIETVEAYIAARADRDPQARELLLTAESSHELSLPGMFFAASTAMRLGDTEQALQFLKRPVMEGIGTILTRLEPKMHPLLDYEPFAPRRSDLTLVWPLEAPMPSRAVHRLFKQLRIDTGLPDGSDIGPRD